ncbi:MAG: TonB-dependent receptor [Lutibacter sp.]
MKKLVLLIVLLQTVINYSQTAIVEGIIKTDKNKPIEGVAVSTKTNGTTTNKKGYFKLNVVANKNITISFSHLSYLTLQKKVIAKPNKTVQLTIVLQPKIENIKEVTIKDQTKDASGIFSTHIEQATKIPGANEGVENLLMTLAGVNNNNELSTQYNVRGGNYDENLVYVNGIEIYRPLLIRSGQQEGLSFINPQLIKNIKFSAGGFQAKYGDKLSSVLDLTYRIPKSFNSQINASLLGGNFSIEGINKKKTLSALLGIRYRNSSLFINSKDVVTNANPNFTDAQLLLSYLVNKKFKLDFLGSFSFNNYNYIPKTRRTNFGTFSNTQSLIVNYNGKENDSFKTTFGALKGSYLYNNHLNFNLTTSLYHTIEQEYFDILANYSLGTLNTDFGDSNFGEITDTEGIGSQLNHARNDLDALVGNIALKGTYKKGKHQVDFGLKYQYENIKDRIKEWEVIDSVGFNVRPIGALANNQPYDSYAGPIVPFQQINAQNETSIDRLVWFAQYSTNTFWKENKIWYNLGIRSHNWNVNGPNLETSNQIIYSIRGQFAIKPDWKKDMLFRIAGGMYNQPPFYKELRNFEGKVIPNVKTQKSLQVVMGNEYSFKLWNRPFKLISEIYYKHLTNVNIYTLDNVKIRYIANNNAKAYATGVDFRLNGEFVPGTQSWVSLGFLKTEQNYNQLGYISRPTDQRFKFGMFFQDYVPNIPNIKMYLNLVFNTGLPGGSPSYANPYDYQNRLNAYKRADIGIYYVFKDQKYNQNYLFKKFKEFSIGFEIFNMFDVQNSITNTWVRDIYSKQSFAVPNYMTQRVFNIKLHAKI